MQPANMLIDPNTLRITAVLDLEFTNSMPAQFTCDLPWWLLLRGPDVWLDCNSLAEFLAQYVPRMEQFLRALERVEEKSAAGGDERPEKELRLSTRMRDSWKTGRFWFNYAARTCLDMDDIYWHTLHNQGDGDGFGLLDIATQAELKPLIRIKMEQRNAYEKECAVRFADEE